MEKKTPLYEQHMALGGKMVPYGGFVMPVQYAGVIEEHRATREKAGLFDVSHMGEVLFTGKDALQNLQNLLTNDFANMGAGRVRYSPMCNERGGVVDDVLVYKKGDEEYLVVVNAANTDKDVRWMQAHLEGDVRMQNVSDDYAQIALQGPQSKNILTKIADADHLPGKYYTFAENVPVAGWNCLVSQTGYTGEFGYEIYCAPGDAVAVWKALLEAGEGFGLLPCGLGARDTLRLEASMPLYGHEMSDEITPLETGLDFAIKMGKEHFIGKAALLERGEPGRVRVGLKVTGRGIIREEHPIFIEDRRIGVATSGTHLPYLGAAYAMALVDRDSSAIGTAVEADVRGRRVAAEIVELPFYKRQK